MALVSLRGLIQVERPAVDVHFADLLLARQAKGLVRLRRLACLGKLLLVRDLDLLDAGRRVLVMRGLLLLRSEHLLLYPVLQIYQLLLMPSSGSSLLAKFVLSLSLLELGGHCKSLKIFLLLLLKFISELFKVILLLLDA